jgi:hypothetical protein
MNECKTILITHSKKQVMTTAKVGFTIIQRNPLVSNGTKLNPILITDSLPLLGQALEQIYVQGDTGPVNDPTIPDGNENDVLWIFVTSTVNGINFTTQGNVILSREFYGITDSMLCLGWEVSTQKWIERGRNEITA